jgi:hypothetical protein
VKAAVVGEPMPTFRKDLCDSIRPHLKGKKISPDLVRGLDDVLDRAGCPRDDGSALPASGATGTGPAFRRQLTDLIRPHLSGGKFSTELVTAIDAVLDRAGVPRDDADAAPAGPPPPPPPAGGTLPQGRVDVAGLRAFLGLPAAGPFDQTAKQALLARLSNRNAPAVTEEDFQRAAKDLGVTVKHIKAVREVEVRKKPFDDEGRPTILFERHIFARHCVPKGRFNSSHPAISGGPYGRGGYGPASAQYGKLADACALDPEAAFRACSWGAFQVMGMHAADLGYGSAVAMGFALTVSEAAHLDCFLRFLRVNSLVDELRACKAGNPASCEPFVRRYNGEDFRTFNYHKKLAAALA